jgi:hypothetical protein
VSQVLDEGKKREILANTCTGPSSKKVEDFQKCSKNSRSGKLTVTTTESQGGYPLGFPQNPEPFLPETGYN